LKPRDYPAAYLASDATAVRLERTYFRLLRAELMLFLAASSVGILGAFPRIGLTRQLAIAAVIFVVGAFSILWRMRKRRFEQKWFQYRAVAESIKTATWRYMMEAPPFDTETNVEAKFLATLDAIQLDRLGMASPEPRDQITDFMREVRKHSFEESKDVYSRERLVDQETWYAKKSAWNRQLAARWSTFTLATQALAIALALLRAFYPMIPLSPVSFLMTVASSMLAWTQARRHEDLVEPYAVAAQELRELRSLLPKLTGVASFRKFVSDVEESISREHTKWLARRSIEALDINSS
jgi:hypothetical protein